MNERDPKLEALLEFLRQSRGFDFTAYKRSTLMRRCFKRMQTVGVEDYEAYEGYLEAHPGEFEQLFNTILINVTSFYRDPASWAFLAGKILHPMLQHRVASEPIRVWSAGCSSGEEAYTLAMVLAETLIQVHGESKGLEIYRHLCKIYATDVDEEALQQARHASYPRAALEVVPEEQRARYFEQSADRYVFRGDLRRSLIFGRHDLIQDPPISRLDLLVCRNTLMYFNADAQRRILARFHFALNDTGYLFLGRAEMLLTYSHLYTPVHLGHRVFAKMPKHGLPDRMAILDNAGNMAAGKLDQYVRLREVALDASFTAEVVIDHNGNLTLFNAAAQALLNLSPKDLGRPLHELALAHNPVELQSLIHRAEGERQAVTLHDVKRTLPDGQVQSLIVRAVPLHDRRGIAQGTAVSLLDVTIQHQLRQELDEWRQKLETSSEELQASNEELETTNEELQASNEELETTNEELHSTIEELQTTNEELQSTTEEMETVNEELQSTNEELQAMNTTLRQRTLDTERLNAFLESILTTIEAGVIVLDQDLHVLLWNAVAADQWGLRADEVRNRSLLTLDLGLPVLEMKQPLLDMLQGEDGEVQLTLPAVNRRGRAVECLIRGRRLSLDAGGSRHGLVLFVETKQPRASEQGGSEDKEPEEGTRV